MVEAAQEWAANRADSLEMANKLLKLRGMESGTRRGKPVFRMADIVPDSNYSNQEIAWNDDYLNPYMGKVYDTHDATEVWTMAVETIASGPAGMVRLHAKHPDLFRMLVGLTRTNKGIAPLGVERTCCVASATAFLLAVMFSLPTADAAASSTSQMSQSSVLKMWP